MLEPLASAASGFGVLAARDPVRWPDVRSAKQVFGASVLVSCSSARARILRQRQPGARISAYQSIRPGRNRIDFPPMGSAMCRANMKPSAKTIPPLASATVFAIVTGCAASHSAPPQPPSPLAPDGVPVLTGRTPASDVVAHVLSIDWPRQLDNEAIYSLVTLSDRPAMSCAHRLDDLREDARSAAKTARNLTLATAIVAATGGGFTSAAPVAYPNDTGLRADFLVWTGIFTAATTATLAAITTFFNAADRGQQDAQRIGEIQGAVWDFAKTWQTIVHDNSYAPTCPLIPTTGAAPVAPAPAAAAASAASEVAAAAASAAAAVGATPPPPPNPAGRKLETSKEDVEKMLKGREILDANNMVGYLEIRRVDAMTHLGAFLEGERCVLADPNKQEEMRGKLVATIQALNQACTGQPDTGSTSTNTTQRSK
jgi:hypothetical protein